MRGQRRIERLPRQSSTLLRQRSGECCPARNTDGTRASTTEWRTHTSRRVNVSEACGGSSRRSKHSDFSGRSALWAITSEPAATAPRLSPDDNSWRNGGACGERWSAYHRHPDENHCFGGPTRRIARRGDDPASLT
jgi:hypothetical protein